MTKMPFKEGLQLLAKMGHKHLVEKKIDHAVALMPINGAVFVIDADPVDDTGPVMYYFYDKADYKHWTGSDL